MTSRLAIFDFDGTLADSLDWFRGILNQVAARHGFRQVESDEFERLRGGSNRDVIRALGIPWTKIPAIAIYMRRLGRQNSAHIALHDGAASMLTRLHAHGVTLAIVSSNSEETVRRALGPEVASLFSFYACGAAMFGKAARFRRIVKLSGIARAEVICIGDEPRDVEAARSANLTSAAVTWGYFTEGALRAATPDHVFARMEDIVEILTTRAAE